ncbi:hypothetical protein EDD85DRAFT_321747 [Armillaria nabsnona]|nr:hypothetical protein EDD85DRAFT_321747 [Armillaria nabsnona]
MVISHFRPVSASRVSFSLCYCIVVWLHPWPISQRWGQIYTQPQLNMTSSNTSPSQQHNLGYVIIISKPGKIPCGVILLYLITKCSRNASSHPFNFILRRWFLPNASGGLGLGGEVSRFGFAGPRTDHLIMINPVAAGSSGSLSSSTPSSKSVSQFA